MRSLTLPAPAKLNLMLHILGRRDDGYHELQTLFQFLDHGDELSFTPRADGQIRLHTDLPGVDHDSNLIVRAARLLQHHSGCTLAAPTQPPPCWGSIISGRPIWEKNGWPRSACHWAPMSPCSSAATPPLPKESANAYNRSNSASLGFSLSLRKSL